ncbi:thioesterase family protein [Streptomyces sp. DSM 116496]|uniref:thioesterase family protein n=1 Tax=Streptomyces stoeckheimensis TaxID=3344656 RepID=UPI0038B403F7
MSSEGSGLSARAVQTVGSLDCATQWGNDDLEVLSTPSILGHMERLCAQVMERFMNPGEMSVGVNVTMHHRAPTPIGAQVEYHVQTDSTDRMVTFTFRVVDEGGNVVCDGEHLRAVVNNARFHERITLLQSPASGTGPEVEA